MSPRGLDVRLLRHPEAVANPRFTFNVSAVSARPDTRVRIDKLCRVSRCVEYAASVKPVTTKMNYGETQAELGVLIRFVSRKAIFTLEIE